MGSPHGKRVFESHSLSMASAFFPTMQSSVRFYEQRKNIVTFIVDMNLRNTFISFSNTTGKIGTPLVQCNFLKYCKKKKINIGT